MKAIDIMLSLLQINLYIYIYTTSKPQLKIESYADSKNVVLIIVTEYGLNHQSLMCCRTTFKDKLYQYQIYFK